MELQTEKKEYLKRENKRCRYDKRLVLEVVKLIEEGMSRKTANQLYGLGASTLDGWMRDYGSQAYHQNKRQKYSHLEKRKITALIEQGRMTITEVRQMYSIKGERTITAWLRESKKEKANFCLPIPPDMAKKQISSYTRKRSPSSITRGTRGSPVKDRSFKYHD